ncbi:hypothetical protein [Roseomonas xinghualingensis]|uniref:hypothetical protein n=1 Tax=Roseomonas xinghualingensis TaxID=2986475 RepID=UPI0021F0F20D|nr:hypothetical protein [Roseomonas sp. SXEYE001]MCV4209031.1 hypothetical protein [Roseomonas sp. SXEYE001]
MSSNPPRAISALSLGMMALALIAGGAAFKFVNLALWEPVFPGLLVAISMLGAAVLVRLARNAPITAPTAFDQTDLERFFDTLEVLSKRLFAIFAQVIAVIAIVLLSVVTVQKLKNDPSPGWTLISPFCSAALSAFLIWLLYKLVEMAHGDIGFLRLQRTILEGAVGRERQKEAKRKVEAPTVLRSSGSYGRALPEGNGES